MKKIIILALIALIMIGCKKSSNNTRQEEIDEQYAERTFIVDSCEYISFWKSSSHKGNCRFCKERDSIKWKNRKKELKKLIIKLKEE